MAGREFSKKNGIGTEMLGFAEARDELPLRYVVTDDFELVMGTLRTSRKSANLDGNPEVAVAIWDDDFSIQIEGTFDEPVAADQEWLQRFFATEFPREARHRGSSSSGV